MRTNNNKILCLVEKYPREEDLSEGFFVHNRNTYYQSKGFEVEVVSFSCQSTYRFRSIQVYCLNDYLKKNDSCKNTILVCHASNLRHHYLFLKRYGHQYLYVVLFFHGHEILKINQVYPEPFEYVKRNTIKAYLQNFYDSFKIAVWKFYIRKNIEHIFLFFVSGWMRDMFMNFTKLPLSTLKGHWSITYNAVGKEFEKRVYDKSKEKLYDFITIRGNLDNSKYAVDIVNKLAGLNPDKKFLLIGKGRFFEYNKKPDNLIWIDRVLNHAEIIQYLEKSRIALMPTRTDAQGVMACEIATLGMPLITSDIPVCHEVFKDFPNVKYIKNDNLGRLEQEDLVFPEITNRPCNYLSENTNKKEVEIFYRLLNNGHKLY